MIIDDVTLEKTDNNDRDWLLLVNNRRLKCEKCNRPLLVQIGHVNDIHNFIPCGKVQIKKSDIKKPIPPSIEEYAESDVSGGEKDFS